MTLLENRVKSLESTVQKMGDPTVSNGPEPTPSTSGSSNQSNHSSPEAHVHLSPSSQSLEEAEDDSDEDLSHIEISSRLESLSLAISGLFFGSSSSFALTRDAHGAKQEATGQDDFDTLRHKKRDYFWRTPPWEQDLTSTEKLSFSFPENSLLVSLISLYFHHVNIHLPVLHEPTFRKNVVEGLHHRNSHFGAVVLAVCAIGARYSDDPQVFFVPGHPSSAGWKWFEQIHPIRRSMFEMPCLYELQWHCLMANYVYGTSNASTAWGLVGAGSSAYRIGLLHHSNWPTTTHEQGSDVQLRWVPIGACQVDTNLPWRMNKGSGRSGSIKPSQVSLHGLLILTVNRVLIITDRLISNFFGRPSAMRDEDFDLELPVECDDEYWEHEDPEKAFQQPPGKPSTLSSFIATIKLCEILAMVLRTMYPLKKSQLVAGILADSWEQKMVAELDSTLNEWKGKLPEHLHWDPEMGDPLFFCQSAAIHVFYYGVQIQAHRRLVQKSSQPSSFPSLAICSNAARSCIRIIDAISRRGSLTVPQGFGYTSGILLLTNIWGSKRAGLKLDVRQASREMEKLIRILHSSEGRFMIAGRFVDMLSELTQGIEDATYPNANNGATSLPPPPDDGIQVEVNGRSPFASGGSQSIPQRSQVSDSQPQTFLPPASMQLPIAASPMPFQTGTGEANVGAFFEMDLWNELQNSGMQFEFEDWNSYAKNVSSMDLDAFMVDNPGVFR
ncbi:Gypsy retrotransposon integrase-like protein 1 [Marasmius sp. AFHP31]|nr:Gypsy retrotransposon integrase-like protein 1 [Marasmius sp. AFHP31]